MIVMHDYGVTFAISLVKCEVSRSSREMLHPVASTLLVACKHKQCKVV